ncbi:hypothetical protein ABPG74_008457 [Tetrahymena malaccensis]
MKRLSWAPFVYLLFECIIIFLTRQLEPSLFDYSNFISKFFALVVLITNIAFFIVHCKDPGYLPIPEISYQIPDQSSRNEDKNKQQFEFVSNRQSGKYNKNIDLNTKQHAQMDSDPTKNKNTDPNTISGSSQDHDQSDQQKQQGKQEIKTPEKSKQEIEMQCEPSMQTENENNEIQIKSLPQSKQNSDEKNQKQQDIFSPLSDKQLEEDGDEVVKIETVQEDAAKAKQEMYSFEISIQQKQLIKNEITTQEGSTKSTTKTNEHITTTNFNNVLTQNNVINSIFTNENNCNNIVTSLSNKTSEIQQCSKLDDSKLNYSVIDYPQTAIDFNAKILNNQDMRNSYSSKLYSFNKKNEEISNVFSIFSPVNNNTKLQVHLNDNPNSYENKEAPQIHQNMHEINILSEIHDPNEAQFVEIRHCLSCHIEQKIRSKHCKICNRCVATYDHHCPWIGNCVGEKNRCNFWWFLSIQFTELAIAITFVIKSIVSNSEINVVMWAIDIILLGFFLLMVGSLLIYHTYLAVENLTTWESARWEKISYLKEWPEQFGSPFNKGMWQNIKSYCQCIKPSKYFTSWYIPKLKNQPNEEQNKQKNIIINLQNNQFQQEQNA